MSPLWETLGLRDEVRFRQLIEVVTCFLHFLKAANHSSGPPYTETDAHSDLSNISDQTKQQAKRGA